MRTGITGVVALAAVLGAGLGGCGAGRERGGFLS
jgi:hypothetical protein